MATPSIVAVRRGDGWEGTYVGYDGLPNDLGEKLLELVFAHAGDLRATWSVIAAAPDGWRRAFSEPYESGANREYFATGRSGPPLLSDKDSFVQVNAVFWFIFDIEARALEVHTFQQGPSWSEVGRFIFSPDGRPQWRTRNGRSDADTNLKSVDDWPLDDRALVAAIREKIKSSFKLA